MNAYFGKMQTIVLNQQFWRSLVQIQVVFNITCNFEKGKSCLSENEHVVKECFPAILCH